MRPKIDVLVSGRLPRRGTPTVTGRCFMLFAGATGPTTPTVCLSAADATTAGAPDPIATWVGDALTQGAPDVVLLRTEAANASAVTKDEWTTALAKLSRDLGPGQVIIPGVSTTAAHDALLAHAAAERTRCVCLDPDPASPGAALLTKGTALAAAPGSERAYLTAGQPITFATSTTTRNMPTSIAVSGLLARGDAVNGHANHLPIFFQTTGEAGVVRNATGVAQTYTDADYDAMYKKSTPGGNVNLIRVVEGSVVLTGFRALSTNPTYQQGSIGRLTMQLTAGIGALMLRFLGRPIQPQLFMEIGGSIRGYLMDIWSRGGLYGETAANAYGVVCDTTNNPVEEIQKGNVTAAAEVSAAMGLENLTINVATSLAEEIAA